jgi:hypothetical protein
MKFYAYTLVLIPFLYIAWIKANPLQAVALLAELKRRYRRWMVRRHGEQAAKRIETTLRAKAGKDPIKQEAIDIVMSQERARIIEKHGTVYANHSLGAPSPLERDF